MAQQLDACWEILRKEIADKRLSVVSLDLPTSYMAMTNAVSDDFTRSMLKTVNVVSQRESVRTIPARQADLILYTSDRIERSVQTTRQCRNARGNSA